MGVVVGEVSFVLKRSVRFTMSLFLIVFGVGVNLFRLDNAHKNNNNSGADKEGGDDKDKVFEGKWGRKS